jgi:hypothetical protein
MFDNRWAGGAAALAIAASMTPAYAQEITASIRGSVVTSSGAPLSGATVSIRNTETGFSRSATTNSAGLFSFRGLGVTGAYDVEVSSPGYDGERVEGLILSVGQSSDLNFTLGAGASDEIIVRATRPAGVEVAVGPAATFNLNDLREVPVVNRTLQDVVRLDPRVFVDEGAGGVDPVQCAGQNPRFNSLTLDGVRLNDGFGLNSNGFPTERQPFPFDAIEQVAVELAPFDVQYGGFTACNINAVTKSGTNSFSGTAFFDYTDDSLSGDSLEGEDINLPEFDEIRYGVQVAGPIIEDKLFFSVAYEKLEGVNAFTRGPIGSGAINEVQITQAELDQIAQIARDVYQYDVGGIPTARDNEDEKLLVKLDWNIADNHRASFTYGWNDGFNTVQSDGDLNEFEFEPHLYERGTELKNYVGTLFSDWTPNFSTELRFGYVDVDNRQETIGGTDFGEIRIETDDVNVFIGGDDSRQANDLNYEIFQYAARGFYTAGLHNLTFGFEREQFEIFNLFVQHVDTEIRFDGIDNFRTGFADRVEYNNAPSLNPLDAAVEWGYANNTLYLQDEWDIVPGLTLIGGLRYDFYTSEDTPAENSDFVSEYGFTNAQNLDGEGLIQPRLAFSWEAQDNLNVRGGVGRYSGGNPNVWLSNTYSANNVLQFGQRGRGFGLSSGAINRDGTPRNPDFPTQLSLLDPAVNYVQCEDGVPTGPGWCVPEALANAVAGGTGDNFEINYLDPDFEIPSDWKFNLGATYVPEVALPGFLGGEYTINLDLLASFSQDTAIILRGDLEEDGGTVANGAPSFDSVREASFVLTNAEDENNRSLTISGAVAKSYDNGIDWSLGYAWNDAEDVQPMTSSVAFSNYTNRAFFNPQAEELATSNYNTEHRFVGRFGYEKAFFGDYATRLSLVGLADSGRPYSIGTQDAGFFGFNPFIDDALVLDNPGDRNAEDGSWFAKVDMRLEQEFPGVLEGHKTSAFILVDNLTNLISDEWGVQRRVPFPNIVDADDLAGGRSPELREGDVSLYQIRFGVRYDF